MEENNKYAQPFDDSEESSFNIMEWVGLFLHHWYLFLFFILLALGLAYLKNRSWIESYKSTGTIILEEGRYSGSQALMQGFGVQSGFRNLDNQVIMLTSYDLISRVIDSIPFLKVDYISMGKFRTRNLYYDTPVTITTDYIDPSVYGVLFKLEINSDGTYVISNEDSSAKSIKVEGRLDVPIQHYLFFMTINRTSNAISNRIMYFRFRTKESLISDFMSRLQPAFVSEGSSVLSISLTSETPNRDIDFINKLSSVFINENLERKNDAATKTINFIDEQLDTVSKSLSISEGEMTSFRRSNQIVNLSSHSSKVLGRATQYDEQMAQLKLRETYLNYLTNYLKTNIDAGSIVAPSSLGLSDPMLISLVQQFNEVLNKKSETKESNPLYARYERVLENLKNSINEVIKNMKASMAIELNDLNAKLANVSHDISALPDKEMQLIGIERKYRVDDNYYTFFLQKRAEAAIQKASNSPDNYILDKARVMALTNGGTKSRTLMTYLLISILIPSLFIILKEVLNTSIRDAKDIEKSSKFPLIGSIKHVKNTDPILAAKRPRSSFTEMFRVIRTRIEFIVQRKSKIMVLITSAESGDGKTYFCTNLASTYGMTGLKTLLIDMDIRKPSINERLELSENDGVTNYLIGEKSLDELILKKEKYNFDILLGGTVPPNPGELIRSEQLKQMFLALRERYDYIIVDTSPIGLVADAYSLAPMMDANLFVARSGKTNKSFFKRLNDQLKDDKLKHFYVILNDINMDASRYGGYTKNYGYGYGYSYGYGGYGYGYGYGYGRKKRLKEANKYAQYYDDDSEV